MAQQKKSNKVLYMLIGLVVVLLIVALVGKKAGWIGKTKALEVETAQAKKTRIVEKVSASGMVQPVDEVKISPDVSGEIIELNIEEGDSVKKGDLLIKIKPDIYQSALERAKANLNQQKANLAEARARQAQMEAQLVNAEADFKRSEQLYHDKVVSEADFETSQANYKVAQSNLKSAEEGVNAGGFIVESAKASVKEAMDNLQFTSITAPVSGIVSLLSVKLGERVVGTAQMAGTEMLRIADLTKMEARVNVNENDIIRVSNGDTATIDVDAYSQTGKKFKGIVTNIANTANTKTSPDAVTEFEVRIRVLNDSYRGILDDKQVVSPFRPGMTASVDIITEIRDNVLSVPLASVTTRDATDKEGDESNKNDQNPSPDNNNDRQDLVSQAPPKEVVFLDSAGTAKMVEVKTGISDFDNIEILSGVTDGQKVITGPFVIVSKRLKNGDAVEVKKDKKK